MFIINEFENVLLELEKEGLIRGPIHSSIGQEAIAAATIAALEKSDQINGTHRAHHLFLGKSMQYVLQDDWNPIEQDLPEKGLEVLRRTFAEIMGLAPGYCGGHGGSMHLRYGEAGFFGSNAVVGGGIPIATGVAFAQKCKKTQNLVISFLGDGATNQGTFHEACNLAAIWDLPIIFFIENNLYAEATTVENGCSVENLSQRASAYGMNGYMVDGYDILAIYQLIEQIKSKRKPCIIEAKTYRHYDHTGKIWGSEIGYRSREEEEKWLGKDAISCFPNSLIEAGILTEAEISRIKDVAISSVAKALDFCLTGETPRRIRPQLWPKPETVYYGLRSNGDEWQAISFREREQFTDFRNILYTEAIAAAITYWFQKSQDVCFIGEEIGSPGSILHSANPEFPQQYATQIFNTPISEAGFVGLSCGAAMSKLRPIVEIMYSNFSLVAADQLFAQIGKSRYLYGNTVDLPIVVRTKVTLGLGMGEHHSMNPVGLFALFPGWRILVPSNAFDYIGLFNSAMQSLDPVLIVEFKSLYTQEFPVPDADLDYFIPLGKARIAEIGEDITIITYGSMVGRCQNLAKILATEGISVEIIDLRSLDFPSIDYDTIGNSVQKTRAVIIVEEAAASQGICKTIAANITEKFFTHLQSPVVCITGKDVNPVEETTYTHPVLFALQYALFELWKSWGIKPDIIMGYSAGDYFSAYVAGVFSLENGLKMATERSRLMYALPKEGAFVAVKASEQEVRTAIAPFAASVWIGAFNNPKNVSISGKSEDVRAVSAKLEAEGFKTQKLKASIAFHTPLMAPMLGEFKHILQEINFSLPQIKLVSSMTGKVVTQEVTTPNYWCHHIIQPVELFASVDTLKREGVEVFLEIGPRPIVWRVTSKEQPENETLWLSSLSSNEMDWQQMLTSTAKLYLHGVAVDWVGFDRDYN